MDKPMGLDEIRTLLEMLQQYDVTEYKIEREGEKLFLKRGYAPIDRPLAAAQQIQHLFSPAPVQTQPVTEVQAMPRTAPLVPASLEPAKALASPPAETLAKPAAAPSKKLSEVNSPMVGTFYRRPAVDADPYVNVGDFVKKGQVLCIVEAMKLMNEIESDYAGRIVEICLEDGQMVEYGEALFRIEPA